ERLVARRRATLGDLLHVLPHEPPGQLARVGDGGGGHDELRSRAVVAADAVQAPEEVGEMATEDSTVRVELVDDDVAKVLKEGGPLGTFAMSSSTSSTRKIGRAHV